MSKLRRVGIMLELDWPYERHVGVFAGTQRYAQECGRWDCVVDEFAHETLRSHRGKGRAYDGVIARASLSLQTVAQHRRVPVVNTRFDSPARKVACVSPDFGAVGRLAAEHLLGLGLRRFACLSIQRSRAQAMLAHGFRTAISAAGFDCACIEVPPTDVGQSGARRRFQQQIDQCIHAWHPPLGVFVSFPDMNSRFVANEILRRGLRIPGDVAVVAGMNEPMLCLHPAPSLTSIDVSYEEVGYQAAKLLDQLMDRRPAPAAPILLPPAGVAARQSTNFLAVDDELVLASLQFLAAHTHKPLNVPLLAEQMHTSRRTLERRFQSALGRTVAEEIRRLRFERAKRQLLDSNLPVKAIARSAGYANVQRLYEVFERETGLSPTKFRSERRTRR